MSTENFSDEDMAVVGRALMEAISNCAPKDWRPMKCPSEIVGDLVNDLEELRRQHRELYFSAYALVDLVCENHPAISGVFNASAHLRVCDAISKLDSQYGVTSPEVRVSMDQRPLITHQSLPPSNPDSLLTNEELTELHCEFDDETQYNYSRALESKILERVIGIADKARRALSATYGRKLADGESELHGNMDWARLQGAVRVVEVLRRLR